MIEERAASADAEQLQVAAMGRLHLVVGGRTLCVQGAVHELDMYRDEAGLRVWNRGSLERCAQCTAALAARIRRWPRATAQPVRPQTEGAHDDQTQVEQDRGDDRCCSGGG